MIFFFLATHFLFPFHSRRLPHEDALRLATGRSSFFSGFIAPAGITVTILIDVIHLVKYVITNQARP